MNFNLLCQAASQLYFDKGYTATSINDMAKACNISKATVYHYTAGKKELTSHILWDLHSHCVDHMSQWLKAHHNADLTDLEDELTTMLSPPSYHSLILKFAVESTSIYNEFKDIIDVHYTYLANLTYTANQNKTKAEDDNTLKNHLMLTLSRFVFPQSWQVSDYG